jgi:hypothetical protein
MGLGLITTMLTERGEENRKSLGWFHSTMYGNLEESQRRYIDPFINGMTINEKSQVNQLIHDIYIKTASS